MVSLVFAGGAGRSNPGHWPINPAGVRAAAAKLESQARWLDCLLHRQQHA